MQMGHSVSAVLVVLCALVCQYEVSSSVVEMEVPGSRMVTGFVDSTTSQLSGRNFSFASYYNSHMVLQGSPRQAVIWGYAPQGSAKKTVQLELKPSNKKYTAVVSDALTWSVKLDSVAPGGPYVVEAVLDSSNISLSDVMFGDVWLCSGQSNMQFSLGMVFNGSEELKDALNYPDIRVFIVADRTANEPLSDLTSNGIQLHWTEPRMMPEFAAFSGVCWLYGKYLYQKLKKPIGLVETCWGGTPVEAWSSHDALTRCGLNSPDDGEHLEDRVLDKLNGPGSHSVLWNGMVHPLLNMTIFGAIWYQGEANAKLNRDLYNCTFPAMIDDWRKKFRVASGTDSTFPFGFVQLAGCSPDYNVDSGFPDVRWHQTADYGYVPNHRQRKVFMAVAMDLPDFLSPMGPVHPRDKQDVAARLALSGLAVAYGHNVSFQGPYPVHVIISQVEPYNYTQVEIHYTQQLQQKWLDGFDVCCSYVIPPACGPGRSWWLPMSTLQAYDRGNVTLGYASQCSRDNVVGIRYAWRETPCPMKNCALYGADNGLPLPPFRYFDEGFKKIPIADGKYFIKIL